ncbi:MAG: hypothetical protein E7575_04445 [Ruminococcaceae bacterium]|nr:hypothetical protein [Oscillospiraceae bacterium]
MDQKNTNFEETALSFLPHHLSEAVRKSLSLYRGNVSELRLRSGGAVAITSGDKNIITPVRCTQSDIGYTVRALCGNSLYSHSETIKEGYICTEGGIRAGVCGRAVTENSQIISVTDISSVCIRIPHRVPGAADGICRLVFNEGFRGMIIYSPPGVGKTTALREFVARLSQRPYNLRIAVIDTRFEICGGLSEELSCDALSGYPRAKGMETALRTLSPQLIVCDEIGSEMDSEAIKSSFGSGVPTVASAHSATFAELISKPHIKELWDMGAFTYAVGLKRDHGKFELQIDSFCPDTKGDF